MSRLRALSDLDLDPPSSSNAEQQEDFSLEGIAANVKLLLKLIQDHNDASTKDQDDRKQQRVAGMITILDDVKTRMQKSQSFVRRSNAELRRCYTDLRPNRAPKEKKISEPITDEKEKLRRQLTASVAARKSLEILCSSLGKEKKIIASELARKVHELNETEELINGLRQQNETLLAKVQVCAAEHKEKKSSVTGEIQGNAALQERNKALSEQLLKSLDGYRSLKRKYKDVKDENTATHETMQEMGEKVAAGLEQIRRLRQRIATMENQRCDNIEEEISALEHTFKCFHMKIVKHTQNITDSAKPKAQSNNASKPSVPA